MSTTRRQFIRTSAVAGGTLALGARGLSGSSPSISDEIPRSDQDTTKGGERSLRILILGGTSFLGPHQVHAALQHGHEVSVFTRGRTQPTIHVEDFHQVEHLIGDRGGDLRALEGRRWDVVLDNSTRQWEWARDSARLLEGSVERYLFISSTGVYYPYLTTSIDETVEPLDRDPSDGQDGSAAYGVMKRRGEQEVEKVFGEQAILARPQHFTGPGENQDRHGYWIERMDRGGEILAMGRRTDPVMLMDVRDLAEFCLHLVETSVGGIFNIAGPASTMTQEEFLHGLRFCTGKDVRWTWVDDYAFLKEHGLEYCVPWTMLEGSNLGYTSIDIRKALAYGLTLRPLADTHRDTREWWYSDAVSEDRRRSARFPLSPEGEQELLAAWKAR